MFILQATELTLFFLLTDFGISSWRLLESEQKKVVFIERIILNWTLEPERWMDFVSSDFLICETICPIHITPEKCIRCFRTIEVLHGSHVAWQEQWTCFFIRKIFFFDCFCHAIWLPWKSSTDQFRYIKILPNTNDLSRRLWGMSPQKLCIYSPEPRTEVYCFRLNINI